MKSKKSFGLTQKHKKIFFGLYQYNKSNIINNHKFDSPKIFSVSRKNMTYSSDENNREENLNLEKIAKKSIIHKTNRKQSKNNTNNYEIIYLYCRIFFQK